MTELPSEIIVIPDNGNLSAQDYNAMFVSLCLETENTLKSPRSRRVYNITYQQWYAWCRSNNINPFAWSSRNLDGFLKSLKAGRESLLRTLSAMRTLARVAIYQYPNESRFSALSGQLKAYRLPYEDNTQESRHRAKIALKSNEVWSVVNVWHEDTLKHRRNRAIIALLFYVGARRFEIASMRWESINLGTGVITIVQGKGGKDRTIAIVGDIAIAILKDYRNTLAKNGYENYRFMFPRINKADRPAGDAPISPEGLHYVVKQTVNAAGISFRPHDARRTLITSLLENGASLADVQRQAGHRKEETTLKYAQGKNALDLRQKLKTPY